MQGVAGGVKNMTIKELEGPARGTPVAPLSEWGVSMLGLLRA